MVILEVVVLEVVKSVGQSDHPVWLMFGTDHSFVSEACNCASVRLEADDVEIAGPFGASPDLELHSFVFDVLKASGVALVVEVEVVSYD